MNLRLEINPDKHSNLKDFICSLKLRCTSEKRSGLEGKRGGGWPSSTTRSLASICFRSSSCGGPLCVNARRGAGSFGQGCVSFSFFLFLSLSSWNGAFISHACVERLRVDKQKKTSSDGAALHLAEGHLCWGGRGEGGVAVSVLKTENHKPFWQLRCKKLNKN